MILKIKFEKNITLKEKVKYFLTSKNGVIEFAYLGISRIDGQFIISIDDDFIFSEPLKNFYYNNIGIENVELLNHTHDHVPNKFYIENKIKLYDFFKKEMDFEDFDLYEEDVYKDIIRRFKLKRLIQ